MALQVHHGTRETVLGPIQVVRLKADTAIRIRLLAADSVQAWVAALATADPALAQA